MNWKRKDDLVLKLKEEATSHKFAHISDIESNEDEFHGLAPIETRTMEIRTMEQHVVNDCDRSQTPPQHEDIQPTAEVTNNTAAARTDMYSSGIRKKYR